MYLCRYREDPPGRCVPSRSGGCVYGEIRVRHPFKIPAPRDRPIDDQKPSNPISFPVCSAGVVWHAQASSLLSTSFVFLYPERVPVMPSTLPTRGEQDGADSPTVPARGGGYVNRRLGRAVPGDNVPGTRYSRRHVHVGSAPAGRDRRQDATAEAWNGSPCMVDCTAKGPGKEMAECSSH